jgi:methyl-accepting chemotaxis protein
LSPQNLPPRRPVLGQRLLATFGGLLLLTLAGSAIGVWSLARVDDATRAAVDRNVATERLVADAYRLQAINAERYKALALSSEPEVGEVLGADIERTERAYEALLKDVAGRLETDGERALLAGTETAGREFRLAARDLMQARDSNLTERIRAVYAQRFQPRSAALLDALAHMARSQRQSIDLAAAAVARLSSTARLMLMLFGAMALLVGGILTLWLVRSISQPIRVADETAQRVASLDLRLDIAGHDRDEAGRLLLALARMQEALRDLARQVGGSAHGLHQAAGEISLGNADLSSRTEVAASSLQQTAAAMEHVLHKLAQSSESAARAETMAQAAALAAVQGSEVVGQVIGTMHEIDRSSRRVAEITGVIDAIAFQTNILSLNAAVEAARAGDAGRGFAVVASEVRQLANRSADAAREIKELVAGSMRSVQAGTALVESAGTAMATIRRGNDDVAGMIGTIAAATRSQTHDIGQINTAVAQLDDMTQQNSALVEQSAASSDGLREQAHELATLISRFQLPAAHAAANDAPRAAAALDQPALVWAAAP